MNPLSDERETVDGAEESASSTALSSAEEFNARTERIMALIKDDPEMRDRLLAEIYVQMSEASTFFRQMQDDFQRLGPTGILSMLRGKRKGD